MPDVKHKAQVYQLHEPSYSLNNLVTSILNTWVCTRLAPQFINY